MNHPHRPRRAGFTLIEMFATVAVLIIVLGLMVSLARYVRRTAAERLTKDLLVKLDALMAQYQSHYHALPPVQSFITPEATNILARIKTLEEQTDTVHVRQAATQATTQRRVPSRNQAEERLEIAQRELERVLQKSARVNNTQFVQAIKGEAGLSGTFGGLPVSIYDEVTLRDAWGTPIVFMRAGHGSVGMSLRDQPFFFSAGPDAQFHTPEDNLYSYEEGK